MIQNDKKQQIYTIWDSYIHSNKVVLDSKGKEFQNINESRIQAIEYLKELIKQFSSNEIDIYEFKTTVDSFNKRNNLWGFTATKGQMFFNQLVKNNEDNISQLTELLQQTIAEPQNIDEALIKIELLEQHCLKIFSKARDKRKVPNPKSVGYFLSYFWQIHNNEQWPIIYTSLTKAFEKLDIWDELEGQKEAYSYFYQLNDDIKQLLNNHMGKKVTNWDAEHAFWNFNGNPNKQKEKKKILKHELKIEVINEAPITIEATFNLTDYLIPKVSQLIELGAEEEKSSSKKGSDFEKLVGEIFKQLDFDVQMLGQGSGRNPDAIIRFREENTAFIIDAKAYSKGYSLGVDDRAIKEYINHHCPLLQKEGYKKVGFIIVSNSFKSNLNGFINEITWNTDIKRFILLSSEALLYLLAYKTKDKINLATLIDNLISFENPVIPQNIIEKFDDI